MDDTQRLQAAALILAVDALDTAHRALVLDPAQTVSVERARESLSRALGAYIAMTDQQAGDLAVCRANWDAARTLAARLWRGSVLATPAYIIEAGEGGMYARHVAPGEMRRNVDEATLVALCELLGAVETGEGD